MHVKRIAQHVRLATFVVTNFRRDLAGWSLARWDAEYIAVRKLRAQRIA